MRISVDGNVGSGKSSILRRIERDLGLQTFCEPVRDWYSYLDEYYRDPKRWAFCLNLKVMTSFNPASRSGRTDAPVSVWERHPFACRHVFTQLGIDAGYIDELETRVADDVMKAMPWMLPDVLIYVRAHPETCMERTTTRGRQCEQNLTLDYLEQVDRCYEAMIRKVVHSHAEDTRVHIVDGNRAAEDVYVDVEAIIRREIDAFDGGDLKPRHTAMRKRKTRLNKISKSPAPRPPVYKDVELEDDAMFAYFRKSPSVLARCDVLKNALRSHGVSETTSGHIIRDVFDALLVPAGVKAHTRGMLFNAIVRKELIDVVHRRLKLDPDRFELTFEKAMGIVSEIPDWALVDKRTRRILIGFNQIDLWSGGHQLNRGGKYVLDDTLHARMQSDHDARILAVTAQDLPVKSRKGSKVDRMKAFAVEALGFAKGRLCLSKDLCGVVTDWSSAAESTDTLSQASSKEP